MNNQDQSFMSHDQMLSYAGMWILKMLDIGPANGGIKIEVPLASEHIMAEEVIDYLYNMGYIDIQTEKYSYAITDKGFHYIREIIAEAEAIIDEFIDVDTEEMIRIYQNRNLDIFRARFLWGLYDGEFDNVVQFQQKRGFREIERNWSIFITSDAFYKNLALDTQI